jgi:hypothetical protein
MPVAFFAPLLVAGLAVQASGPVDAQAMAWFAASEMRVDGNIAGQPEHYRYRFQLATNHDMRVEADYDHDGKPAHGTMVLVGGWLAVKDLPLIKDQEIDTIDGAVITYQMAARLLSLAATTTPDKVAKAIDVNLSEPAKGFSVSTASADMTIPAPWNLRGKIQPGDHGIDFDLDLSADLGHKVQHFQYRGSWIHAKPMASLPGSFSLAGWRVFHLGPVKRVHDKSVDYDYGADEITGGVADVNALRNKAREPAQR